MSNPSPEVRAAKGLPASTWCKYGFETSLICAVCLEGKLFMPSELKFEGQIIQAELCRPVVKAAQAIGEAVTAVSVGRMHLPSHRYLLYSGAVPDVWYCPCCGTLFGPHEWVQFKEVFDCRTSRKSRRSART